MVKQDRNFEDIRDILLLGFLSLLLFCGFNSASEKRDEVKREKNQEYVLSHDNILISESPKLRISKPVLHTGSFTELDKPNFRSKKSLLQKTLCATDFFQIKIFLSQNIYNLYFASGFHEPPLAA